VRVNSTQCSVGRCARGAASTTATRSVIVRSVRERLSAGMRASPQFP
jgi:hypothetical protein